jgi:O-antigen/teichoic acid export membrane protein
MSNLKDKTIKGVYWTSLGIFLNKFFQFFVSIILARILLPEEFGLIAMISIFVAIGVALMDSGLGQSLIRSDKLTQDDYSSVFYFNIIVSICAYVTIYFLAPYVSKFFSQSILTNILRINALVIIINSFSMVQIAKLTKEMDFKTQAQVSMISTFIGCLSGVVSAFLNCGVWSLIIMYVTDSSVNAILYLYKTRWYPSLRFSIEILKKHFKYGYKLTLSSLLETIFSNIYSVILGRTFSPSIVGFYNRSNVLWRLPAYNVSEVLSKVSFPLFVNIKDDKAKLKITYRKILKIVVFILTPILLLMGVLAEPLFEVLFTEKWLPAVPYFQILLINGIIYPINKYSINILKVYGLSGLILKIEFYSKLFFIGLIPLGLMYGVYGLICVSVVISFSNFLIYSHFTGKILDYKFKDILIDLFLIFLISLATAILTFFIYERFLIGFNSTFLRLIFGISFGSLTYIILSYVFKVQTKQELILFLKKYLKNKRL